MIRNGVKRLTTQFILFIEKISDVQITIMKINLTNTEPVIDALENAPRIIVPLVKDVPAKILKRRPQPDKWSAHEHACHLAAVHLLFRSRLDLMLSEKSPRIKSYLPNRDEEVSLSLFEIDEEITRN